jgi:hypothetical protein
MGADSTLAPPSATTLTTNDDAAIFAAWDRRKAAYAKLEELRPEDISADYTPEERDQFGILDAAEETIRSSTATTARGVELQLWTGLYHLFAKGEASAAALNGDLAWFDANEDEPDWSDRLVIAAIRSLRAQQEAETAFADAWLARWTKEGGAVVIDDQGKVQASFTTYELSPVYQEARSELGEGADRQNNYWNDGRYYGTMNALFDVLKMAPSGISTIKAHMRARGIRVVVPVGTGAA